MKFRFFSRHRQPSSTQTYHYAETGASERRLREIDAMIAAYPRLGELGFSHAEESAEDIYKAYCAKLPSIHPPALEASLRSSFAIIAAEAKDPSVVEAAQQEIARSDIRDGIVHSTLVRKFPALWASVQDELKKHEAGYGAAVFSRTWPSYSRGNALIHYIDNHHDLFRSKRILHVAAEAEVINWMEAHSDALDMQYETLNLAGIVDYAEDLTKMDIPSDTFDWIFCHRVLEHVFDDQAAAREAYRVLKPGGIFNISVPESMQMPLTLDWGIPDRSHHFHYRQYGADVVDRLNAIGFHTSVVDWLLTRPVDELDDAGTYPLRAYNAQKPA